MNNSLKKSIPVLTLMLVMVSMPNVYAENNIFQNAIQNPTGESATSIFSHSIPADVKGAIPVATASMDDTNSRTLATNALNSIFETIENDIFAKENLDMISENFGDKIFGMISSIISKTLEVSFSLLN